MTLKSGKDQEITLRTPSEVKNIVVKKGKVVVRNADNTKSRMVSLPSGQEIQLELILKQNSPPVFKGEEPVNHNGLGSDKTDKRTKAKKHPIMKCLFSDSWKVGIQRVSGRFPC